MHCIHDAVTPQSRWMCGRARAWGGRWHGRAGGCRAPCRQANSSCALTQAYSNWVHGGQSNNWNINGYCFLSLRKIWLILSYSHRWHACCWVGQICRPVILQYLLVLVTYRLQQMVGKMFVFCHDRLQRVLNAAARLVSGTRKYDCGLSTLLYDELHWLDVPKRIQFKLGVAVHRCLQNKAPVYLIDCCSRVADTVGRRHLRSASQHYLTVLRYRLSTLDRRAFSDAGPAIWNSLVSTT